MELLCAHQSDAERFPVPVSRVLRRDCTPPPPDAYEMGLSQTVSHGMCSYYYYDVPMSLRVNPLGATPFLCLFLQDNVLLSCLRVTAGFKAVRLRLC
jgi:hypothetical protein